MEFRKTHPTILFPPLNYQPPIMAIPIVDDAGYDTPTFASTASPLQRRHAESAIVNSLVEMMIKRQ
jgi:hypothetical protein